MKTPKPNTVKNPIFAEYYSHMNGDCYKLKLPWTTWREHVLVLCLVTDGIEEARRLAKRELTKHMKAALAQVVPNANGQAVSDNNHKVWCLANDYHGSRPCNCGAASCSEQPAAPAGLRTAGTWAGECEACGARWRYLPGCDNGVCAACGCHAVVQRRYPR